MPKKTPSRSETRAIEDVAKAFAAAADAVPEGDRATVIKFALMKIRDELAGQRKAKAAKQANKAAKQAAKAAKAKTSPPKATPITAKRRSRSNPHVPDAQAVAD